MLIGKAHSKSVCMPNYKKRFYPHQVRGDIPFCGHRNYLIHPEPANRIFENDNLKASGF